MEMKLTKWFPAYIKPVHVGWYQVSRPWYENGKPIFLDWDGDRWLYATNEGYAIAGSSATVHQQGCVWRGLAEPFK